MNKKGNIHSILGVFFTFSILSVMFVTLFIINFGITNDYILYTLQDQMETLENDGVIPTNYSNITKQFGDSYHDNMINFGDNLWLVLYILFILLSIFGAYEIRTSDEITGFMFLFYGMFIFLFIVGIISIFSEWVIDNIINKMLPNFIVYFPKFNWYIENIGIISLIHCILLFIVTKLNFNFARKIGLDNQEISAIQDEEESDSIEESDEVI